MSRLILTLMFSVVLSASVVQAQAIAPSFAGAYSLTDLGSVPGVPSQYGGLTLKYDDTSTLLLGGGANGGTGALYSIGVIRGAGGHITGFAGSATAFASAPFNDGGVSYGPNNVLFLARWPVNELGQLLPTSTTSDKVIDMTPFGLGGQSLSAINFVPAGMPAAGKLKLTTYSGGQWAEAEVAPDGAGTFDLINFVILPIYLPGGPEGFVFVPAGRPLFPNHSLIVSEYGSGAVTAFELDANSDPIVSTRRIFVSGLAGAEGAFIDPVTGDFLFSTFGGGSHVIVIRGFANNCTTCRGDMNANNTVDGGDVSSFVACLLRGGALEGLCHCADMDNDTDIDGADMSLFVLKLLGTSDSDTACP